MSREILAAAVLGAAQLPLLALHRRAPERSLAELLAASACANDPVRLALFHYQNCEACATQALVGEAQSCARGARMIEAARGWRPRAEVVAEKGGPR